MKKIFIFSFLTLYVLSACCAYAAEVGVLNKSNSSEEEFNKIFNDEWVHSSLILSDVYADGMKPSDIHVHFYNSVIEMILALNRGEIDLIMSPIFFGEYMLRNNPDYTLKGVVFGKVPLALSFGFLKEKEDLQKRFNDALTDMNNGALSLLIRDYVTGPYADNPRTVKFDTFEGAETINIAVTGDLPPIDYIAPDGTPAGFNTALLAEIGRRLRININPVNIESGARMAALKSGRVDVVFWIEILGAIKDGHEVHQSDLTEEVIYSKPYYGWNQILLIGRKR